MEPLLDKLWVLAISVTTSPSPPPTQTFNGIECASALELRCHRADISQACAYWEMQSRVVNVAGLQLHAALAPHTRMQITVDTALARCGPTYGDVSTSLCPCVDMD